MYMNRVTIAGFVGANAKHSTKQAGRSVTRFSLATTKRYKEGDEYKDKTQWHDCVVFNLSTKFAENVPRKGAHLLIEGELAYREYERTVETDEGPVKVKWPVAEIIVHSIAPLDRKRQNEQGTA